MEPRSFLAMLAGADLVLVNGLKVSVQTSELSPEGDDDNEIACFSWGVGETPNSVKLTEGGVREGGRIERGFYGEQCFIFDDDEGDPLVIEIYRKVAPIDRFKRTVSLNFTLADQTFQTEVSEKDIEEMKVNMKGLVDFAINKGLTHVGDEGIRVVDWSVTAEGSLAASEDPAGHVPLTASSYRISEIQSWITKGWLKHDDIHLFLYACGVMDTEVYLDKFSERTAEEMVSGLMSMLRGLLCADLGEIDYQAEVDRAKSNLDWAVQHEVIKPCEYASLAEEYGMMTLEQFGQAMKELAETNCQT